MLINYCKNERGSGEISRALFVIIVVVVLGGILLWWRNFRDSTFFREHGEEAIKKLEQDIADLQTSFINLSITNTDVRNNTNSVELQQEIDQAVGGIVNNVNSNANINVNVSATEDLK